MNPSPDFQPPTPAASYPRFRSAKNNVGIWARRCAYREDLSSRQICRCWPFGSFRGGPLTARDSFSRGPVMMFLAISFRWPLEVPPSVSDGFPSGFPPEEPPSVSDGPFRGLYHCHRWPFGSSIWFRSKAAMALIPTCFRWSPFRGLSLCHRWPAPSQVLGSIVIQLSHAAFQGRPGHKRSPRCPTGQFQMLGQRGERTFNSAHTAHIRT